MIYYLQSVIMATNTGYSIFKGNTTLDILFIEGSETLGYYLMILKYV